MILQPLITAVKTFLGLSDTPSSYSGEAGNVLVVNGTEDGLEFGSGSAHSHANKAQLDLVTDGDHDVRTDNPHTVTTTQLSLNNVTNDAQLKRAAGDINTFTEKASPVSADLVLIEDSADSYNKKKAQLGNLPGGGGGSSKMIPIKLHPMSAKVTGADISQGVGIDNDRSWRILFDDTTVEEASWQDQVINYQDGNLSLSLIVAPDSTQTGVTEIRLDAKIMAVTGGDAEDIDSDGFAAYQGVTVTLDNNHVTGRPKLGTITFTKAQADTLNSLDYVRILVRRDPTHADDDCVGDVRFYEGTLYEP